jgi:hypothetical protein
MTLTVPTRAALQWQAEFHQTWSGAVCLTEDARTDVVIPFSYETRNVRLAVLLRKQAALFHAAPCPYLVGAVGLRALLLPLASRGETISDRRQQNSSKQLQYSALSIVYSDETRATDGGQLIESIYEGWKIEFRECDLSRYC